jgi:hypothetical protein
MITTKNQYCIYMYLFFRDKYRWNIKSSWFITYT